MGKASIKEDKTYYQICREEAQLTREKAADILEGMTESRIECIEYRKANPVPEDIVAMAKGYKKPEMCNYYCANECKIGKDYIPQVKIDNLAEITVNMLSSLNAIENQKERFVDIVSDGIISDEELEDYIKVEKRLEQISLSASALKVWFKKAVFDGRIDNERYHQVLEKLSKEK